MKKILSIFICVSILMSSVCAMVSAEKAEEDKVFKSSFEILNAIGILTEYDDLTLNTEKTVSRAEFADTLAKLLKLDTNVNTMYYHDVSKSHFAYKSITALTERGYMNGVGEDMFSPDAVMKNSDAARVILNVMGYGYRLIYSSSPEGELQGVAKDIDLSKNITLGKQMTMRDMVVLLKNALIAPTMQIDGISGGNAEYVQDYDETLLSQYYDCHYVKNERVIGANGVSIYKEAIRVDYIKIGEREYLQLKNDMEEYIGSYVDFIYKGEIDEDDGELIWIEKNGRSDEYDIQIEESGAFDSTTYRLSYYNENDKKKYIDIERNATVIYNGGFVDNIESVLSLPYYRVRAVENRSGDFDVLVVSDYTNFIIGSKNTDEMYIRNKTGDSTISLNENDYTKLTLFNSDGNELSIGNLAVDDVVSVYKSLDGEYIRLIVSGNKVSGNVESKGDDDGVGFVVIDSEKYEAYGNTDISKLNVGEEVTLYLDASGKIAYVQNSSSSMNLMYITKVFFDGSGLDEKLTVKAYTQDGNFIKYTTASKVKINGTMYKKGFDEMTYYNVKGDISQKIATCKFNADGEITSIETPRTGGELVVSNPLGSKYYRSVSTKFGSLSCVDNNTVFFSVPSDVDDEKDFSVKSKGGLGDYRTFNAECYQFKGNSDGFEDVVLIKDFSWNGTDWESVMCVVTDIYQALNEDEEIVTAIDGFVGSTEKTFYCAEGYTASDIQKEDFVLFKMDNQNKIVGYAKKFNKSSRECADEGIGSLNRVVIGYANEIVGDIIRIGYTSGGDCDEAFQVGTTPVVVIDTSSSRNNVSAGTIADIGRYNRVMIETCYMVQKVIVVYK